MKKRILSSCLVLIMLCSIIGSTVVATISETEINRTTIEDYVMEQVEAFSVIDDAWNETTQIVDRIPLYAPDDSLNGYIFNFETNGKKSGFMQVGILEKELYVVNLGFEGNDLLNKMINHHNILKAESMVKEIQGGERMIADLDPSSKVYYTGGFNYYVYSENNELVSLAENKVVKNGISEVNISYISYIENMMEKEANKSSERQQVNVQRATENYTVRGYSTAASRMKTMNYWSNYSDHCAPTAAVNMVMYWKYGRGFFANHAASSSQTSVFNWFYNAMETNQGSAGTDRAKIWPAYAEYFTEYSGASTAISDRVTWVTFDKIRTRMDEDIPVHLSISNYENVGGHSVNVWGYSIVNSNEYLRISDNWGSNHSNILIAYNSYNYPQYVFYGLSA